jgi:3-carboxy-cis,cis-muconate cycloisomerase
MSRLLAALAGDPEIEALLSDDAQLGAILRFEIALAEAEATVGFIDEAAAREIAVATETFTPDWPGLIDGMRRDGVVVPALIAQLRAALSASSRSALHKGATSQDALDTGLILQIAAILPIMLARIDEVRRQLAAIVGRHGRNELMAHTRMQAALLFTVADKIATWDHALERHRTALDASSAGLLVVQLGGPIGNRSSFGGHGDAIADGLASRLGLGHAPPWHTARDRIVGFGSRLAMLAGTLGKIGADVALMAQTEVGTVTLASGGMSSAMPHKANPVDAELLVALARHAGGLAGTLNQTMIHENERSGAAWTLEWLTLAPLIVTTGTGLEKAKSLLSAVRGLGRATN